MYYTSLSDGNIFINHHLNWHVSNEMDMVGICLCYHIELRLWGKSDDWPRLAAVFRTENWYLFMIIYIYKYLTNQWKLTVCDITKTE